MSAPKRGAKKYELTQPQSKERVEVLRHAKTAGKLFHATHGEHLNSNDFFKSRAIDDRKKKADAMLKEKRTRYEKSKLREQALQVIKEHGEPTTEKIKDYPAKAMQKLYEWKHNKKSSEAREKLLEVYLKKDPPKEEPEWTMSEEIRLKELLTEDMYAKDTALGVQLKQTAKALANNIDDLDEESKAELLQKLQGDNTVTSFGDDQRAIF